MTLLLVRHAVALRRSDWTKPDHLRPLTPRGAQQADALVAQLAAFGVDRILTSPSVRCVETVQPLAAELGLPVEELPQLAEGQDAAAAELLRGLEGGVVACSHGDVLPALLAVLAPGVVPPAGEVECEKGSTWVLPEARYLPPPA
jgi:8-oxo-(d)GTP phosphatase